MATSKPTTKAKTKTTKKKPAARAAAKTTKKSVATTAAKTTKAKKPAVKATAKATKPATTGKLAFLKRPHVAFGGVFAVAAILAGVLMNNFSAQVLLGHLAKDELASRTTTVLAPAAHILYEVEIRWVLVALLAFAAVFSVLRGTRLKAKDDAGIKAGVQPLRWIDFAVSGALAFEIAALLNGLQDAAALKFGMVFIVLAAVTSWLFERENAVTGKPSKSLYVISLLAVLLPLAILASTIYASYVYGIVRSPWWAYTAAAVVAVTLIRTVRLQWTALGAQGKALNYAALDKKYNLLSVVSKVALAVVLIVGLYK